MFLTGLYQFIRPRQASFSAIEIELAVSNERVITVATVLEVK